MSLTFSIELESLKLIDYNLLEKFTEVKFCSLTWHIDPNRKYYFTKNTDFSVLNLSEFLIKRNKCVLLHIPCRTLSKYEALTILDRAKIIGVKYILAVRGDSKNIKECNPFFPSTIEFVRFIKMYYGNYFSIGVAGYPRGHPLSQDLDSDLEFLKSKVLAGANFILSQFEFDFRRVEMFLHRCQLLNINVPVIVGIYVVTPTTDRMASKCGVVLPNNISKVLNQIKYNPCAVENFALCQVLWFLKKILLTKQEQLKGVHVFSMNKLFNVYRIYKHLNF